MRLSFNSQWRPQILSVFLSWISLKFSIKNITLNFSKKRIVIKFIFISILIFIAVFFLACSTAVKTKIPPEKSGNTKTHAAIESIEELRKKVEDQQREIDELKKLKEDKERTEYAEKQRIEAGRAEAERIRLEKERTEAERIRNQIQNGEAERLRIEKERVDAERIRIQMQNAEMERLRLEKERAEAERLRIEREKAEAERLRIERERAEAERIRLEQERAEAERLRKEREVYLLANDPVRLSFYRQDHRRLLGDIFTITLPPGKIAYLTKNRKPLQFHGYTELGSRLSPELADFQLLPFDENIVPLILKKSGNYSIVILPEDFASKAQGSVSIQNLFELPAVRTGSSMYFIINISVDKNGVMLIDAEQPSLYRNTAPAFYRFDADKIILKRG
jgi:hypothetical protein